MNKHFLSFYLVLLATNPLLSFYASSTPANLDDQSPIDYIITLRTLDDFRHDFKALYGVERPEDLPPLEFPGEGFISSAAAIALVKKTDFPEQLPLPLLIQAARTGDPSISYLVGYVLHEQLKIEGVVMPCARLATVLWYENAAFKGMLVAAEKLTHPDSVISLPIAYAWQNNLDHHYSEFQKNLNEQDLCTQFAQLGK